MELICKIMDEDIGEVSVKMDNPRLRLGARGIVVREDGKIAVFNKSNKNEYKLPGGGIEGEEKPEEAFKREMLEDTKQLNITQKEKDEGAKLIWETPEKALKLITESYDKLIASKYESVYHTQFIVWRDRKILEKYIEMEN